MKHLLAKNLYHRLTVLVVAALIAAAPAGHSAPRNPVLLFQPGTQSALIPIQDVIDDPDYPNNEPTYERSSEAEEGGPARRWNTLSDPLTEDIAVWVKSASDFCERLPWEYRIDCLADQFHKLARSLPSSGPYAPVRRALFEAAEDLRDLAEDNRDPEKPEVMARLSTGGARASRPLVPVSTARREEVIRKAEAIIEEASTVLLRSAENSENRMLHYSQVAKAIDSSKVLLRSA